MTRQKKNCFKFNKLKNVETFSKKKKKTLFKSVLKLMHWDNATSNCVIEWLNMNKFEKILTSPRCRLISKNIFSFKNILWGEMRRKWLTFPT